LIDRPEIPVLTLMVAIVGVRTFGLARPVLRYAERLRSHDTVLRLLASRRVAVYDALVPLDIMTYFLLKAVLIGDIEEAERLGILECDEEDFALCTFACPSKTDVGGIIREGLEYIEKEG